MAAHAFDVVGVRRYEWKCDALNEPSRGAAARLGFTFEGIFRQAVVYKGRNRDTAWFAITDAEWPGLRAASSAWLDPANFDEGRHAAQRRSRTSRAESRSRRSRRVSGRGASDRCRPRGSVSTSARLRVGTVQVQQQRLDRCRSR